MRWPTLAALAERKVGDETVIQNHKGYYNISSDILRELGIDEHETNIGIYVRKLLRQL